MGARWSEEKTLIDDTILPLSGDYDDEAIHMDNPGFFHTDLIYDCDFDTLVRDNFFTRVLTYLLPGVCINSLEHLEHFC